MGLVLDGCGEAEERSPASKVGCFGGRVGWYGWIQDTLWGMPGADGLEVCGSVCVVRKQMAVRGRGSMIPLVSTDLCAVAWVSWSQASRSPWSILLHHSASQPEEELARHGDRLGGELLVQNEQCGQNEWGQIVVESRHECLVEKGGLEQKMRGCSSLLWSRLWESGPDRLDAWAQVSTQQIHAPTWVSGKAGASFRYPGVPT